MSKQPTLWDREPAAFLGIVASAIALVSAFGLNLTGDQVGAIMGFTSMVVAFITRSKVSPVDTSGMFVKRSER